MGMKNKVTVVLMLSLLLLILGCRADSSQQLKQQSVNPHHTANQMGKKPVIVILIDSLMDKPLQEAIQEGRAPAMRFLLHQGQYFPQVVSSFPTMSVTIDSTLLTGTYADQHHVPGLVWYSDPKKRMILYGNGAKEALKIDQLQVFNDAIYQLNQVQLNKKTKTIHEALADKGKESASINAIVFRGRTEHSLKVPRFIANSNRVPEQVKITGPKWFSYATFAQLDPGNSWNTSPWKKLGMNDEFSAKETAFLINQKKLPNLTITYFPGNDNLAHRKGPTQLEGIEKADQALQTVLNAYGSWEEAVQNATWIVLGDSGQSAVYNDRQAATVDIRPLLGHYRIAKLNQPVRSDDQIVIAANERMAYIYAIDNNVDLSDVVKLLQHEKKLDIIAMKDGKNNIQVTKGRNGSLFSYHPGGKFTDEYGQSWTLSGETNLVDITINNNRIKYGKYPDVLARLYGAMNSHEGRYVVVTVQPGYELVGESSPTHIGGGAHGSLHEQDSLVPLIISGTNTRPKTLRIVDIKDWLLQLVNE
ncbi:alkaline phosphatase family protein [Paenibacillus polymyxa]|uniref:Type i phosphodiesterase/nucleotide pyrophosphatase n=1 Tax=Paenibacillus polymyxa TaxID=1406 RepID=A0A378Y5S7_PAEPO|nr:alkaline phosphatase family protein [Paenibacillus polymyxa]MBE7900231.1 alkaline phosphatase family protein [Paenibacillus polymyxa]MCC3260208.1 alkaline phosphatase family protein [Paenibacillus polymyxa]QPK53357.1 alkaline phosphatase family protein [Paenibacillus polymyxa]QPK58440.1 alkaline phosphatase family protein [Paenibacillus polymyxa]UOD86036.1 phosphodiesterase [Paenibacillus polymyxa ATCC 842]